MGAVRGRVERTTQLQVSSLDEFLPLSSLSLNPKPEQQGSTRYQLSRMEVVQIRQFARPTYSLIECVPNANIC